MIISEVWEDVKGFEGDAPRKTNIQSSNIGMCCRGEYKTAGGYKWSFKKLSHKGKNNGS